MSSLNETRYFEFLSRKIIQENEVGIHEVTSLESKGTFPFSQMMLENIAKSLEHDKPIPNNEVTPIEEFREYLDVFTIFDGQGRRFYVLVYDSDELSQNPVVLRIIARL